MSAGQKAEMARHQFYSPKGCSPRAIATEKEPLCSSVPQTQCIDLLLHERMYLLNVLKIHKNSKNIFYTFQTVLIFETSRLYVFLLYMLDKVVHVIINSFV